MDCICRYSRNRFQDTEVRWFSTLSRFRRSHKNDYTLDWSSSVLLFNLVWYFGTVEVRCIDVPIRMALLLLRLPMPLERSTQLLNATGVADASA